MRVSDVLGENELRVKCGDMVRHKFLSFTGIAVSRCEHLDKVTEVRVMPITEFGGHTYPDGPWFLESQLEKVDGA